METLRTVPADRRLTLGVDTTRISFAIEDLCRHTMIFGSSGSGKTTRAFNPMLESMMADLEAGAFIIAPKSEAVDEAIQMARRAGRKAVVVTPGSETGFDLLSGNPDVDAMYLRDTFGRTGDDGKAYVEAAVARLKNCLRMLQAAGVQYYNLQHLTEYCFDEKFSAMVRNHAVSRMRALDHDSEAAWTIREAMAYEDTRYNQFTPETRRAVLFTVSQLLEPLRDVKITKTFASRRSLFPIESVFSGAVIILHVPRTRYERAAQAIYTLAKRRFFTALENRRASTEFDQTRPVVFAVDEYQLCISESDIQSLGIIRSAGCMVLAATHGMSSLYSVLSKSLVDAAIQNFTQKFFFKTDDHETLSLLERVVRNAHEPIDVRRLFSMHRNQAMCHVTVGDRSHDGVLELKPLFVTPDYFNPCAAAS
jgi:type IV secretory pathway TraG/TraD family ATPase VirD4